MLHEKKRKEKKRKEKGSNMNELLEQARHWDARLCVWVGGGGESGVRLVSSKRSKCII